MLWLVGTFGRSQFTHIGVLKGEQVTLYCFTYLYSVNNVHWRLNSDVIVQRSEVQENYTERFNFSCYHSDPTQSWYRLCKLTILDVQIEDSGEYSCYDFGPNPVWYSKVTVLCKLFASML